MIEVNLDTVSNIVEKTVCYNRDRIYYMLNYSKNMVCFDNIESAIYKSVIFDSLNQHVLSFAPPKSLTRQIFQEKNPDISSDTIIVREFIDGIMVNLFYDKRVEKWEISSRYKIGGDYFPQKNMAKKRTLTDLFLDALCGDKHKSLDDNQIIRMLPKVFSYTFVLKITDVTRPQLYLVAAFMILNYSVKYVSPRDYEKWNTFINIQGVIQFPKIVEKYQTFEELEEEIENIQHDCLVGGIGYMVTNHKTGEQTKYLYDNYVTESEKKKQQPNLEYQYLYFRRISRIANNPNWLYEVPNNRKQLIKIHLLFEEFIMNVHISYMEKYVFKKKNPLLPKYEKYVDIIHKKYRHEKKQKITRDFVRGYFDEMEPRELLYMMHV